MGAMRHKVLVVSDKESFTASVTALIMEMGSCDVTTCASKLESRDYARDDDYDVIIINSPIFGELADDFAKSFTRITYSSIIVLTPAEISERLRARVLGNGIVVVNKPLSKKAFLDALNVACLSGERAKVFFDENKKLEKKMAEMKKVERAKVLLVECLKFTEDQAHRYIEQQAMELRKTSGEIAQSVINTYGTTYKT